MPSELLLRGAEVIVTMDGARREIAGGDVLIRGGVIAAVGVGLGHDRERWSRACGAAS